MRYRQRALAAIVLTVAATFPLFSVQQPGREPGIARTAPQPRGANLETIARDLSDKSQDAWNNAYNRRVQAPVELYVALAGFAATTKAYWQMTADGREEASLRNTARSIVSAAADIDNLIGGTQIEEIIAAWRLVQSNVFILSNAYNLGYRMRGRSAYQDGRRGVGVTPDLPGSAGRFRWRGQVDGSDYVMLQGTKVTIRHLEFNPITGASYELPNPLPQAAVQVSLRKIKGRGTVEIVRQPIAENHYTVTVLIEDAAGGSDFYEFELTW